MKNTTNKKFFLLIILLIFVFLSGCSSLFPEESIESEPALREPPEPRISLETVEKGTIREEISGLSRVAPKKEEELYFEKDGRIREIMVEQGEDVEKGQVLAKMETADIEYEYKQAKLDLELFEMEKERMEFLLGSSVSEYDLNLKEIDYQKLKLRVDHLKNELDNSIIHAPFDGRIMSLAVREAEMVDGFAMIMSIADISDLELQMEVHSREINDIVEGLAARIQIEEDLWVDAEVNHVPSPFAEITPGERDLRVRIDFSNLDDIMDEHDLEFEDVYRFNSLLNTRIVVQEVKDALLLPPSAIREYGNRTFVLVQEDDTRKEIDIETGLSTSTKVEIVEGLEEGQEVISR
ncbi:MAG: efflux RND transporter periplasmic adaptor subunit [Bacillota bacterium]